MEGAISSIRRKAKRAAEAERKRREASRKAAAPSGKVVEKRAMKKQLDALETTSDGLSEKERALTASDEARRLREVASQTKAQRKNARS